MVVVRSCCNYIKLFQPLPMLTLFSHINQYSTQMNFESLPSNLYTFGFDDDSKDRTKLSWERVEWVLNWVLDHLSRRSTLNHKISSYVLKHVMERNIDSYVANGEMIAAMYLAGYNVKREDIRNNGPNAVFNLDPKCLERLRLISSLSPR